MHDNAVLQFKESLKAFDAVFDQLCLTIVAIKKEDKWLSLYTCLALNNSEDAGRFESRTITAGSELIALFVPYPTDDFERLFNEMLSGALAVDVGLAAYQIFLNRIAAGFQSQSITGSQLHFMNIWKPLREYAPDKEAFRPTIVLQTLGDRFYELVSHDDNERISKRLRTHKTPFNGLDGLLQFAGTRNRPNSSSDQALVEIKMVLPFSATVQEDQVLIDTPQSLASKLSMLFFFSGHESLTVAYTTYVSVAGRPNVVSIPFRIQWPTDVSRAQAHLLYESEEIEAMTVRHWSSGANWRVTVDSYFDPESKFLKEALQGDSPRFKGEKRSEAFEQAIVRLLTLAGMAVTWHGALRQPERPDLAGYCELPGRRVALIGECTLEKPSVKLSTVKSRVSAVLELAENSAEILPVVFTACDPAQSDYRDAAKEGIALVGRNEIGYILELVERNAGVLEVIKQIENSKTINDFPDIARWNDRYS